MSLTEIKGEHTEVIRKALYQRLDVLFAKLNELGDAVCIQADKKEK